jgi:hypothetical protein
MKKIPTNRLLTLIVLFAFLLSACSISVQASTVTISPTQTYAATETFTPEPIATNTDTPTPTIEAQPSATATSAESGAILTPKDIASDDISVSIITYETGSKPDSSAVKREDTYAELDVQYGPGTQHWIVITAVFYKPGAGAAVTQMAANEPADEFQVCNGPNYTKCKLGSMDQLKNYALWAQKMFGDNDHVVKLLVGYPTTANQATLNADLKIFESGQVLAIISTPKAGGLGSWNNPIVEWSLNHDPQLFTNLQNFATSADPSAFSNPLDIYEFELPE